MPSLKFVRSAVSEELRQTVRIALYILVDNLLAKMCVFNCCLFQNLSRAFNTFDQKILVWKLEKLLEFEELLVNSLKVISPIAFNIQNLMGIALPHKETHEALQRTTLGSLLFLLYVNDLPLRTNFWLPYKPI